ncbi:pimeloyl-ACP methyl ester carboxylesterase [Streptomyces sp. Amel2xB2]|uniref:alpha/beta fold hydrolase n=1 Tax=Streptomyces sp. Amel2xB2 TaxID=1305829 RepID=UPI000DB9E053|nr:alpha/beta hydrolase [Streptomyces sp. Amel2xB2]RAJ56572.1 pimeloyl-ACP methyl ester carboxylesterase [Streptomyces sp. Amel2xB2]
MTSPQSLTVDAHGYVTHYWELAPDAPESTVVLVHDGSFGSDAWTTWSGVIPRLAERYRVLAPDLLGFGGTDKVVYLDRSPYAYRTAHLAAFCAAVGVAAPEGAHFVGHSFGGSLVLRALASTPSALPARSGVSISGSGGPWRSRQALEDLGRFDGTEEDVRRLLSLMMDEDRPGFDENARARYANTRKPGHVEAILAGRLKHPAPPEPAAPAAASASSAKPAEAPWPEPLRDCPVPVLIVGGDRDTLLEPGWTEHFEGLSPTVSVRRLGDARHAPNVEQPEATAELLGAFLSEADRAGAPAVP